MKPSLYGIVNSNRDFSDPFYWGKNQFNSAFPVALACYMRDQNHKAVFLKLNKKLKIDITNVSFDTVFNTNFKNEELYFSFETRYLPFEKYVHDELKPIDLVIKNAKNGEYLQPLEIKLTTLPDNSTSENLEEDYGSELVIRSPTMRYLALSIANSCENKFKEIREIFEPNCHKIRNWDNSHEISNVLDKLLDSLELFCIKFQKYQRPLLMQPIWKTIGKSSDLAENCLDIFVWTDFALTRLFMDSAIKSRREQIIRQQRAAIRLVRFLYELSLHTKVFQQPIYDGMTFDTLNDKEFAISGDNSNQYMRNKVTL